MMTSEEKLRRQFREETVRLLNIIHFGMGDKHVINSLNTLKRIVSTLRSKNSDVGSLKVWVTLWADSYKIDIPLKALIFDEDNV